MSWPSGVARLTATDFLFAVGAQIERIVVVIPALRILQIGRAEGARVVAGPRPFDLDHLGAEIGQHLRRKRPRQHARQI